MITVVGLDELSYSFHSVSGVAWDSAPVCIGLARSRLLSMMALLGLCYWSYNFHSVSALLRDTVKPRPEAHMDMILFEVFLKSIDLIPQQQILQRHYLHYR